MSSSPVDFERAAAYFQQSNEQGQSLYSHLSSLLLSFAQPSPLPISALSTLSLSLKQSHLSQLHLSELPPSSSSSSQQQQLSAVKAESALLAPALGRTRKIAQSKISNLLDTADLLASAGVALSRDELFLLTQSVASVAAAHGLSNLRYWGTIYGTSTDYLILETAVAPHAATSEVELAGQGINAFSYYVATSPLGPFTRLPEAVPALVATSLSLHRLFTGKLAATIPGHPAFPGTEADYLRCVIGRISHGAFAVPKGSYELVEGDQGDTLELVEGWEGAGEDVRELAGWVYQRAKILRKGRTTPYVPADAEDAEEQQPAAAEEEDEEAAPALTSLADESPLPIPLFTLRCFPVSHPHCTAALSSTLWPGAVSLAKHRTTLNVYTGWGVKYRGAALGGWRREPMALMRDEWRPLEEDEEALMQEQEDVLDKEEDKDDDHENDEDADDEEAEEPDED